MCWAATQTWRFSWTPRGSRRHARNQDLGGAGGDRRPRKQEWDGRRRFSQWTDSQNRWPTATSSAIGSVKLTLQGAAGAGLDRNRAGCTGSDVTD